MKKLWYYIPAVAITLAGIALTTSCVDDKESDSVTALRGARTEQIKAEGALATAMANAEGIRAAAEAALKNAEAAKAIAESKVQEALAAQIAATTEADKATAAIALQQAQLAYNKAKADGDLAIKTAENALAEELINAQLRLKDLQDQLALSKTDNKVLNDAISKYSALVGRISTIKSQLLPAQLQLAQDKALLADRVAGINVNEVTQLKYYNQQVSDRELWIEENTISIDNWNKVLTNAGNVEAEIKTATDKRNNLLSVEIPKLSKSVKDAVKVRDDAQAVIAKYVDLPGAQVYTWYGYRFRTIGELNILVTEYNGYLANNQKALTDAETAYNKAAAEVESLYTAYQNALKKRTEVYSDETATLAQKEAADISVNDTSVAYYGAKTVLDENHNYIVNLKNSIAYSQKYITDLKATITAFGTDKNMLDIQEAYDVANAKVDEANKNRNVVLAEIASLGNMIYELSQLGYGVDYGGSAGLSTANIEMIKVWIKDLEDVNEIYTTQIANLNRSINYVKEGSKLDIATLSNTIKLEEERIAALTTELNAIEKQAEIYKGIITEQSK